MIEYIVPYEDEYYRLSSPDKMRELVRCKDCLKNMMCELTLDKPRDWFCADGKKIEKVVLSTMYGIMEE